QTLGRRLGPASQTRAACGRGRRSFRLLADPVLDVPQQGLCEDLMSTIEAKLEELGLPLPTAPPPVGAYVPVIRTGNLVVTSGQLPFVGKQIVFEGKLGAQLHEQDGWNAARICTVNALAQIKACVGSLSQIKQVVRVEGYV